MNDKLTSSLCGIFLCFVAASMANGQVRSAVDWPQFLSRHDLVWTRAPQAWHDGPFMGNGMLGTMLHQLDEQTFRISLGRSDVEDHKTKGSPFVSRSRLPIGYFTLKTAGKVTRFSGRLDLYNAQTTATVQTEKGTVELRAFVHSEQMLIVYESKVAGDESVQLEFVPLKAIAPARYQAEKSVRQRGDKAMATLRQCYPTVFHRIAFAFAFGDSVENQSKSLDKLVAASCIPDPGQARRKILIPQTQPLPMNKAVLSPGG